MKNLLPLILTVALLLCLASCETPKQKQEPDTTTPTETSTHTEHTGVWNTNEFTHHYQFTCGCPYPDIAGEHNDLNADLVCDTCGYQMKSDTSTTLPDHTEHTGVWNTNEYTHHYQYTCGCPSPDIAGEHYDHDNDGLCDACGYEMPAKTCTQPFEWVGYEEGHVMRMLCDCCEAPDVIEPHEDKNGDLVCDLCGYVLPEHKHSYSYYKDEITHGWSYTCGCLTPPNVAMHADGNRDGKCDVCDYPMPPEHTEHTGRWGCGEESHWYEYTCGCVNNDIAELHYDHDNDGLCDACAYMVGVKQYYSLMMSAPEWLYEELKHTYYEGETVSVKISMATDVGFLFFVNGEEISDYQWDSGIYWEFTFPMPACDTIIHFKTYDGFLPDWNYAILMETYLRQNLDCPGVWVRHYYGEFASGAIVAMLDVFPYTELLWQEKIGDTVIQYYDGNRITVLYENVFYTLTEAYENGYLTQEDIATIAEMHNNP